MRHQGYGSLRQLSANDDVVERSFTEGWSPSIGHETRLKRTNPTTDVHLHMCTQPQMYTCSYTNPSVSLFTFTKCTHTTCINILSNIFVSKKRYSAVHFIAVLMFHRHRCATTYSTTGVCERAGLQSN